MKVLYTGSFNPFRSGNQCVGSFPWAQGKGKRSGKYLPAELDNLTTF